MLIFQLIQRHIRRRRLQSILFVLGVALGVAVGVAIDLANGSANRAFSLSAESITGRTTHRILGGTSGLDASVYTQVRDELGITEAAPLIETYVRGVSLGDQPLRLLGVEISAESPFRTYLGKVDDSGNQLDLLNAFLSDQVFISQTLAARFGLQTGDNITLRVNAELVTVQIGGLLYPTDTLTRQALDDLLLLNIDSAQNLLGMSGKISRVDLILPQNYDTTAIATLLPPGAVLATPRAQNDALSQMTDAFEINLQALSLLALVVGVFLIYNTVMFSVVQRRQVIGIMRALGTSKRQIFLLVIGEALLLGAVGTGAGLLLGVLMGQATVQAVSQSISDLYFRVNVRGVEVMPATLLRGALVGVGASLLAAFVPALDATRTTPAGSMRRSDQEQSAKKLIPYLTGVGVLLILGGALLLKLPQQAVVVYFVALFMIVIGAALFTPLGMLLLMHGAVPLGGRLFGVLGRMAPRAVARSLSRTVVAVAALTLAVSVIVGVGVMIASFRSTVVNWLDITLGADIFISTPGLSTDSTPNIDPALIQELAAVAGVRAVPVVREVRVFAPDYPDLPPAALIAVSHDLSDGKRRIKWDSLPEGVSFWDALRDGKILVSEPFAFKRGITPENNTITLLTDQGEQTFEVAAVYYDYTSDQGRIMMHLDTYRTFYADPYITSLAILAEPQADIQELMTTLRTQTLVGKDLEIQSNRELREGALEVFDRTFSITVALQVLAIIVAFIGILSALMALQLEHVREYGILRANGMTPAQLRGYTLLQTTLMGLVSGMMALPIGLALAFVLIYVINVRSFGWTISPTLPPGEFIQAFGVALVAAILAGLYPAWRVSRVQAAAALRGE